MRDHGRDGAHQPRIGKGEKGGTDAQFVHFEAQPSLVRLVAHASGRLPEVEGTRFSLTAYSCRDSRGIGAKAPHRIPFQALAGTGAIDGPKNGPGTWLFEARGNVDNFARSLSRLIPGLLEG